jgi:hypothetical protein
MKTKRVVVGGSAAFAGSLARQSAPVMLAVALLGATALACKSGNGQENGTPADPGPAAAAQGGDVIRYTGMEVAETGQTGIRQAVQARRAADWSSPMVVTLYPGTQVSRVARYGNFSLVSWSGPAGAQQQGWVDTNVAFSAQRIDAGTGTMKPAPVFGAVTGTAPPTVTATPTVSTTPTVTAPKGGFQPRQM